MTFEQAKKRSFFLKKQLEKWNYEYFVNDSSVVSDNKYDLFMKELIKIEQKYNKLITTDSPTQNIFGKINNKFNKYIHTIPMLSLGNIFNYNGLINFDKQIKELTGLSKIEYICELKIDGLSISLVYKNNFLIAGSTRGNGFIGENVTNNIKKIKSIPLKINKSNLIVRGEVYLSIKEFNKINKERVKKKEFKLTNPRNAAAGTLRQLDSSIVSKRKLNIFLYYYINALEDGIKSQYEALKKLYKLKFKINPEYRYCSDIIYVWNYIKEYELKRNNFDYKIDGIVIKVNNLNLYNRIGYTSKNPKWAIAYKFKSEVVITKLLNIFSSVGRTGLITYNAIFEPIMISGTIIRMAKLHSANFIINKDIRIGDNIQVKKAGDIIPEIINYVSNNRKKTSKKWQKSTNCPECNTLLENINSKINQYCKNYICPKKIIRKIEHFCSINAMNIKGVSQKIIEKLFKKKYLNNFSDLYKLEKYKYKIIKLKNFGEKLFRNIMISINNSKNNSLERLLFGLGIHNVGQKISKLLAINLKTIDNLFKISIKELLIINDIGPIAASSIVRYFKNIYNIKELCLLKQEGINMKYINVNNYLFFSQKLENQKFVISGILSKSKEYFKELIKNYGGKILENISIKTTYLLVGINVNNNKLTKAYKLNIKIINEIEFKQLLNKKGIIINEKNN